MMVGRHKLGSVTVSLYLYEQSDRRRNPEHFHQSCSDELNPADSGLFGFRLRFGSVAGYFKPAPSPKPRQKPKILAAHRYTFSVNALKIGAIVEGEFQQAMRSVQI
jgi:hypothetical protein